MYYLFLFTVSVIVAAAISTVWSYLEPTSDGTVPFGVSFVSIFVVGCLVI